MPNKQSVNLNNHTPQNTADTWYRLRLFNYFRVSLALLFITVYFNDWFHLLVSSKFSYDKIFLTISVSYLIASLFFFAGIVRQKPQLEAQVIIHTLVDVFCIILLMHAAGGIRSGLGMLLIISVSMSSLFLKKRLAIAFAAIATLSVITEQVYSQLVYTDHSPAFTQAGLLGILIFISALLTIYTEKRLKESEKLAFDTSAELESIVQLNEHIIKSMRTGIMVIKNNGLILMANNAALELLGHITIDSHTNLKEISAALYSRFLDWNNNEVQNHQPVQQTQGLPDLQPGFSHIQQNTHKESSGPNNHLGKHLGRTLIFLEDATQLTQRFQQVKLASLGRLTASIAHEIRNPLAAINHAGQLLDETSENEADKKLTAIINTQSKRLNGIVENVLQLSRQQRGTPETINLYQWLLKFREEFISTNKLKAYQIQIQIKPKDITILFDSSQLHQVMWNLCSNAINHSNMEASNIMVIIKGEIDSDSRQPYLDIIDNGPGINQEIQAHIFDPFFTTRNEGSGLGLYITKEVIESNRAKIHHISPVTGGTCFRIYFQQVQ
jgi:two-component system sensor histidine kinase PilS (NtrC family)